MHRSLRLMAFVLAACTLAAVVLHREQHLNTLTVPSLDADARTQ